MKFKFLAKFFIVGFTLLSSDYLSFCQSQTSGESTPKFSSAWGSFSGGPASGRSGIAIDLASNIFLDNKWGGSVAATFYGRVASLIPYNYNDGLCFVGDCVPHDRLMQFSIRFGRYFSLNKIIRFHVQTGPSLIRYTKNRFVFDPNPDLFDGNYEVFTNRYWIGGLSGFVNVDFLVTKTLGLTMGLSGNLNPDESYCSLQFGLVVGMLRK